jgi:membrane protein DedA with SNARE-associated domain
MESLLPYSSLLDYSLAGVAAVGLIEKFIPVMPSYVMLVLFGMTLVDSSSELSLIITFSVAGSVARFGRYILLKPALYERLTIAYQRNHFWVTTIGQVVPTARIYLALPAGVIGLPAGSFLFATLIGTLAWNAPLITLGYLLQNSGWSPIVAGTTAVFSLIAIEAIALLTVMRRKTKV